MEKDKGGRPRWARSALAIGTTADLELLGPRARLSRLPLLFLLTVLATRPPPYEAALCPTGRRPDTPIPHDPGPTARCRDPIAVRPGSSKDCQLDPAGRIATTSANRPGSLEKGGTLSPS